jgi:hypothetical protein
MRAAIIRSALRGAAITALIAGSLSAVAFSPNHHREFSLDAVKVYLYCAGQLKVDTPMPMTSVMKLADGARLEDSSQLFSRASNWHYARNPDMPKTWLGFATPHLEKIFPQRIEEMETAGSTPQDGKLCSVDSLYTAAGRVAHYIQDMRVPAHVIPIHHGFVFGDDGVDTYVPSSRIATWPTCDDFKPYLDQLPTAFQLKNLLTAAASDTSNANLAAIDFGDGRAAPKGCTWEQVYWCDRLNPESKCNGAYSGFGHYRSPSIPGDLDARSQKLCERPASAMATAFERFFRKRYEGAVRDTAAILFMTANRAEANRCLASAGKK